MRIMNNEQQAAAIGAKVRRARKAKGWTLNDLAAAAGISPNTANALELGRRVRPGNLRAVLDALEMSPEVQHTDPTEIDGGVRLAMDLVQKWLEALPKDERVEKVQELTRFIMLSGD